MNRPHAKKDRDHSLVSKTVEEAVQSELVVRDFLSKMFEDKPAVKVKAVNFSAGGEHEESHLGYDISVEVDRPGDPFSCNIEVSVGKEQKKWTNRKPEQFRIDAEKYGTQCWPKGMNSEGRKEDNSFDIYLRISNTGESWWAADWGWIREMDILKMQRFPDAINRKFKEEDPNTSGTDNLFGVMEWSWYTGANTSLSDDNTEFIVKRMSKGVEESTGRVRIVWFDKYEHKNGEKNLKKMIRSILQDKMEKVFA